MPTFNYSLEKGEPKRLKIVWNISNPPNLSVILDGIEIENIPATVPELSSGHQLDLPDGSILKIQLIKGFLSVSKNNIPLPNSPADPYKRIRNAYVGAFCLGGLSIYVGALATLFFRTNMILTIILGVLLIILGFLIKRESLWALIMAIIIQVASNTIPNLLNIKAIFTGGFLAIFTFAFRIYWLYQMIMGIGALQSMKTISKKSIISRNNRIK
jgi:hypothetical protein